eukprot:9494885-Pyramimonas_sp.AAC.1
MPLSPPGSEVYNSPSGSSPSFFKCPAAICCFPPLPLDALDDLVTGQRRISFTRPAPRRQGTPTWAVSGGGRIPLDCSGYWQPPPPRWGIVSPQWQAPASAPALAPGSEVHPHTAPRPPRHSVGS